MSVQVDAPQAFSVREENEFYPIQHLVSRLNPKLVVSRIATGRHVHGGPTVFWGVVYLDGEKPSQEMLKSILDKAGYDFNGNGAVMQIDTI